MKSKGIGRLGFLLIFVIIFIPIGYTGIVYFSINSATISIANPSLDIGITEFLDLSSLADILLNRELSGEFNLVFEGHGLVATTVKSLQVKIFLEGIQLGIITSNEFFTIPASGIETAHMKFHLDLSSVSLDDIETVVNSISSHNGEVVMSIEGFYEPVILIIPINMPVRATSYAKTITDGPKVLSLSWDALGCEAGDCVGFDVSVKNVFRGSEVNGIVDVLVREDVKLGFDDTARSYPFPIHLQSGESASFSEDFVTYMDSSIRGFFLRVDWGSEVLGEQSSGYPPRLGVSEGYLELEQVYWTVEGYKATSCILGNQVNAHIKLKAYDASVTGSIRVKIRKDKALLLDEDVKVEDYYLDLSRGESRELVLSFLPDEESSGNLRGYFIEIEGDVAWTMSDDYPPRLVVNSPEEEPEEEESTIGIPLIQNVWWTVGDQVVSEASQGHIVKGHVRIKAYGGGISGMVTVRIRKDKALLPDEDYVYDSFPITLGEDQTTTVVMSFTASDKSGFTFRGYFIQVDLDSWDTIWTMESEYPPRLSVN